MKFHLRPNFFTLFTFYFSFYQSHGLFFFYGKLDFSIKTRHAFSHWQEQIPVLVLNGYDSLERFMEIDSAVLDYLQIHQQEHREKILTAVQLLHDLQCKYGTFIWIASSPSETAAVQNSTLALHFNYWLGQVGNALKKKIRG